ncbi:MAG: diguanylate cyclase [Moraxellaceae bacterium]|jgi:diguanylate cyclase (GGDEF)-like protein|nr:diguanylate cyclase [Moraxellaceae bacterium]
MSDPKGAQASGHNAVDPIAWWTNPLDWRPLDRMILLGLLVMLAPGLMGVVIGLAMLRSPEYLHLEVARPLMAVYGLHLVLLTGFLVAAMRRRERVSDWPAFEIFVIGSFMVTVYGTGFLTGTHFAEGLLLVFLGIFIASALGSVRRLLVAFYGGVVLLVIFALSDVTRALPNAPLLARPLVGPDGSVVMGMIAIRIVLATVIIVITRLVISAITRWVERENLYREMSNLDGLTRLCNRRSFLERGESELSRSKRLGDSPVACIMLDLDHFKKINDTYGHHAGDQVLVAASAILLQNRRQYDEVGRYGGEEFALLLPNTSAEDALHVADRIRGMLANTPVESDGHRIRMTASFGVASCPARDITCLNDLLKAADRALYVAKESGRNRVCLADPEATA